MKKILLMRHGKSDWSDAFIKDFNRPLNERGEKSSILMGKEMFKRGIMPDIILSSPALRAKSTAEFVAKYLNYSRKINYIEDFYFGYQESILKNLQDLDISISIALVIGHNPTWENLISALVSENISVTMSTATLVSITAPIEKWSDLNFRICNFDWILSPKDLI